MTTSGTTNFNETRDQLITNALQLLGVVASGESAQPNDVTFCASLLNAMVKGWMAQGIHLWTEEEGTVYFVNGQAQYALPGANGSDGTNSVETSLTQAYGAGSTSLICQTVTGMSSGDTIGVQMSNNVIFWTTINGAPNTTTNTVLLTSGITTAANSGAQVFSYTVAMPRPLSIQSARCRDSSGFDRWVKIIPREDYMRIPEKFITGQPIILYYSPQLGTAQVYVWPAPSDVSQRIKFTYLRTIDDFDTGSDTADFPQEWLECITYNLAVRVAPSYGINLSSGGITGNPDILRQAASYLDELKAWDAEQPYIQYVPGYRFNR